MGLGFEHMNLGEYNHSVHCKEYIILLFFFWLEQQEFIFSQFWKLEVQDEGVGRISFFWDLSLLSRWSPSLCVLTWSFLCTCAPLVSLSIILLFIYELALVCLRHYIKYIIFHMKFISYGKKYINISYTFAVQYCSHWIYMAI